MERGAKDGIEAEEDLVRKWLTLPGRVLLMVAIAGTIGGGIWYFEYTIDAMPRGSYPVFFWVAPVVLVGAASFFTVAFALERLGVRVYRRGDGDHAPDGGPPAGPGG